MSGQPTDADRKDFFERARKQAEEDCNKNKRDASALTRWGGALLELANYVPSDEAPSYVNDAVNKFQEALSIDPKRDDALWCLGNAYTSQGFLSPQKMKAMELFARAKDCFTGALQEKPDNPIYKKGLEMTGKAPDLYDEIQKQLSPQPRPAASNTFWFDVLGYVTVVGLVFGVSYFVSLMSPQTGGTAAPKQP